MIIGIYDFYDLVILEAEVPTGGEDPTPEYLDGEMLVFKNEDGYEEVGKIVYISKKSDKRDATKGGAKILRKTTAHDLQKFDAGRARGDEAVATCAKLAVKHGLDMQPFYGMNSFDGIRANVMFTAEDRVDFRELVKDLAKALQKQIHLKQIGPRDKAKITDGFGRCGRKFCCRGFLPKLESISMDMVRAQSLESKGSSKLSGACGKLLCCLKYEVEAYKDLKDNLPPMGSKVKLKKPFMGTHDSGAVVSLDVLNQNVKLYFGDREYATVSNDEIAKIIDKPISTAPKRAERSERAEKPEEPKEEPKKD